MKMAIEIKEPNLARDLFNTLRVMIEQADNKTGNYVIHRVNMSKQPMHPFAAEYTDHHSYWASRIFDNMVSARHKRFTGFAVVKFVNLRGMGYYFEGTLKAMLIPNQRMGKTCGFFVCKTPDDAMKYLEEIKGFFLENGGKISKEWENLTWERFGAISKDILISSKFEKVNWRNDVASYPAKEILITTGEYVDPVPWSAIAVINELTKKDSYVDIDQNGKPVHYYVMGPRVATPLPSRIHDHLVAHISEDIYEKFRRIWEDYVKLCEQAEDLLTENFPRWSNEE